MAKKHTVDGLNIEPQWPEDVDPTDWRNQPDPDGDMFENDEDGPTPNYVVEALGVDPDDLFEEDE